MKKLGMLTVIVMLMTVVTTAQAEVRAGSISVTPFFGGYVFEGNEYNLDNSWTAGVRAGYNFTKNLGVEGYFNYILTETTPFKWNPNGDDVRIGGYGIEGLYHFMPQSWFVPFLAVGIGGIHYDFENSGNMNKLSVDYGAGVKLFFPDRVAKFFLADDVALRGDVRHILPLNDKYNDFLYTAGIAFSYGGKKKAVEPSPVDSDGDGVFDDRDKCPNTPRGCIVDEDGCPIDSDKDGVIDCRDKCPDTPQGCIVDKDGCPIDSDKDGVCDGRDKCPDTPAGCIVDKDGCPLDSDKDGVNDCLDKCPNTPAGAIVDKDGCMHEKITMNLNVEFDYDKSDVKDKYNGEIKKVADFMKEFPKTTAVIAGNTDSTGSNDYNQKLSERRANSVRKYLINKFGIEASRLSAIGYGETKPIATNDTDEGRQRNRRVDAVLEAIEIK
jgi:OOP family OmpA-OmpF porin